MKKIFYSLLCTFILVINTALPTYYSQCKQDEYIHNNFFSSKTDGFYVEIGAHDGIQFSNTKFFENLGWAGICIEPIEEIFNELCRNRNEKCICVQAAISDFNGSADFLYIKGYNDTLSGLINKYDVRHVERIKREGTANHCQFIQRKVDCVTFSTLLEKYSIDRRIDYLSIDTEGGELDILKAIDYSKIDIDIITVEDIYDNTEIRIFMESQGFIYITTLDWDLLFRNKKYYSQD